MKNQRRKKKLEVPGIHRSFTDAEKAEMLAGLKHIPKRWRREMEHAINTGFLSDTLLKRIENSISEHFAKFGVEVLS